MKSNFFRTAFFVAAAGLGVTGLVLTGFSQPPALPPTPANATFPLAWDATHKDSKPEMGAPTANFQFLVTNISDAEVVIARLQASCSCTVGKLPSQPWHLAPHADGHIDVTVNLAGKSGKIFKTVTVYFTNAPEVNPLPPQVLSVSVDIPLSPAMKRNQNQMLAMGDRQRVFTEADCASCHAEPTKGKMDKELYVAACGICHDAIPRASMTPDLHDLKHPVNLEFWRSTIANGVTNKPRSAMPAFATSHKGPLTDEQIDSLAQLMMRAYPQRTGQFAPPGRPPLPQPPPQQPQPPQPGALPPVPPHAVAN